MNNEKFNKDKINTSVDYKSLLKMMDDDEVANNEYIPPNQEI